MIKLAVAVFALLALPSVASAAVDPSIEAYVKRSLMICPGSNVRIESIAPQGPFGMQTYRVQQTSTEEGCGRNAYAVVSPKSGDIIFGDIVQLPAEGGALQQRLQAFGTKLLKKPATATVGKPVGTDGLRPVTITSQSRYGGFDYHGYVDSSGRYLIIGRLGNRNQDASEQFLASIGAQNAAMRGNSMGRIRILELSDFQCPTCGRAHQLLEPFFKKNLNKISYSRLDLSLFENHDWSFEAAMAARAIQKFAPAKYWAYVDHIFTAQDSLTRSNIESKIKEFVGDNDLDWKQLGAFYNSAAERKKLLTQISSLYDNGVLGTPTFVVNGQPVFYGQDGSNLKAYLERLLAGK